MEALGKGAANYYQKDRPTYLSNIPKINKTIEILTNNPGLTGGIADKLFGNTGLSIRNEDSHVAQQSMQAAITDTLRPTLGAQFTEAEGNRILSLSFDVSVGAEENKRRAQELKGIIQRKVQFQDDLYAHLAEHGDDRQFPYSNYGMQKDGGSPISRGSTKPVSNNGSSKSSGGDRASEIRKKYGL